MLRQIGRDEALKLSEKGAFLEISRHKHKAYDSSKESNPDIEGNKSRDGFKYSCNYHRLGRFFQGPVKDAILKAIHSVHGHQTYEFDNDLAGLKEALYEAVRTRINNDIERKQGFMFECSDLLVYYAYNQSELSKINKNKIARLSIDFAYKGIQKYDSDSFVYEDERLIGISEYLKAMIKAYRNDETLLKIVDICIFMMKEDIYYRPRWIQILQDIYPTVSKIDRPTNFVIETLKGLSLICTHLQLTEKELINVERWG